MCKHCEFFFSRDEEVASWEGDRALLNDVRFSAGLLGELSLDAYIVESVKDDSLAEIRVALCSDAENDALSHIPIRFCPICGAELKMRRFIWDGIVPQED